MTQKPSPHRGGRTYRTSLAAVLVTTAATAVFLLQPHEHKPWQEYQQAPSYDAGKEPHELAEVVFRGVLRLPIGKVEQNVGYDAENGERHQGNPNASCALAVAHGGRESAGLSLPSLRGHAVMARSDASVPVCTESKSQFSSPFLQPLKYPEFLVTLVDEVLCFHWSRLRAAVGVGVGVGGEVAGMSRPSNEIAGTSETPGQDVRNSHRQERK